jgi:DNA (cytosine-5)-methyltransferase 1
MENVPGLKRVAGVSFEQRISKYFRKCGYVGSAIEVDASKFGVPQRRKRLIFICARRTHDISNFKLRPVRSPGIPSVTRALKNLPRPSFGPADIPRLRCRKRAHNHRAMVHSRKVIRKIAGIKPGTGPISYRRLRRNLANTLIAGHRAMPVHPRRNRTITVREAARLQTMPDSFRFLGPHSRQPLQVANVVPYRLSRAIARSLLLVIKLQLPPKDR